MNDRDVLMRVIGEMALRIKSLGHEQADALKSAATHYDHGDYTREAIDRHAARTAAVMAEIYQELSGLACGTWFPEPDEVEQSTGLGLRVGLIRWTPPEGATVPQLRQWRMFVDELYQETLRQRNFTDDALKAAQATQQTGRLAPEDLSQPDPLTAPVEQEETGAHPVEIVGRGLPVTPPDGTPVPEEREGPAGYPEAPAVAPGAPVAGEEPRTQLPKRVKGLALQEACEAERRTEQGAHPDPAGGDAAPGGFQDGGPEHA
ncbi:hypothetical protein [Actinomadura litoris]|uniref:Uncharacterized protein n=1 Tax=Actinomadura litoris TaxID=2678616 RepID=A0A7K1LAN6_9ACTN|nr:hypothetical protein [Actinomadura litoris]MUN41490.1 hypothetical protein [Actinomadura litoris]